MLIRVNTKLFTMPESMSLVIRTLTLLEGRQKLGTEYLSQRFLAHATILVFLGLWFGAL